jgi:hypothetical protein
MLHLACENFMHSFSGRQGKTTTLSTLFQAANENDDLNLHASFGLVKMTTLSTLFRAANGKTTTFPLYFRWLRKTTTFNLSFWR